MPDPEATAGNIKMEILADIRTYIEGYIAIQIEETDKEIKELQRDMAELIAELKRVAADLERKMVEMKMEIDGLSVRVGELEHWRSLCESSNHFTRS